MKPQRWRKWPRTRRTGSGSFRRWSRKLRRRRSCIGAVCILFSSEELVEEEKRRMKAAKKVRDAEMKRRAEEAARLEAERKELEAKLEKERLEREAEELKRRPWRLGWKALSLGKSWKLWRKRSGRRRQRLEPRWAGRLVSLDVAARSMRRDSARR